MKYELALVINGTVNEDGKADQLQKVKDTIIRFGGEIVTIDDWGRRRLAYEIQKVREGFYYFITFTSDESAPSEIEKRIRIMEDVLRFLIVKNCN